VSDKWPWLDWLIHFTTPFPRKLDMIGNSLLTVGIQVEGGASSFSEIMGKSCVVTIKKWKNAFTLNLIEIVQQCAMRCNVKQSGRNLLTYWRNSLLLSWGQKTLKYGGSRFLRRIHIYTRLEKNSALLGYYRVRSGNFLTMFPDNLSVPFTGQIGYRETSVRNYHYLLHKNPEECNYHLLHRSSL